MDSSKELYYRDYSGTWHVCSLESCQNTGKGYVLPPGSTDIETVLRRHKIFLARNDVLDSWYIPDVEPNTRMFNRLIERQKEVFEENVKEHWLAGKNDGILQ